MEEIERVTVVVKDCFSRDRETGFYSGLSLARKKDIVDFVLIE